MTDEEKLDLIGEKFGVAITYNELDRWIIAIKEVSKILENEGK